MQTLSGNNEAKSRLFFALWPDDATRQALAQLIPNFDAQAGKPVPAHNFHVTLVFLGNVDQTTIAAIKQRAAKVSVEPFQLIFESVSFWQQSKVICITCRSVPQQAFDLASKLDMIARQCGLQTDARPYVPHITLTRHAQGLSIQTLKPIVLRADSFCLVQSCSEPEGVVYRVLQRWPFTQYGHQ